MGAAPGPQDLSHPLHPPGGGGPSGRWGWVGAGGGLGGREDGRGCGGRGVAGTGGRPRVVRGASRRGGVMRWRAAKAVASLVARDCGLPDDIKEIFLPAMRHRVVLDPAEEIEGGTTDQVLTRILDTVEVPR